MRGYLKWGLGLALACASGTGMAEVQAIADVCGYPLVGDNGEAPATGIERSTVGNYEVSIANAALQRFPLDDHSWDLHEVTVGGSLGSDPGAGARAQIFGIFYTYEKVAETGQATYPTWYMIQPVDGLLASATPYVTPLLRFTYNGKFADHAGTQNGAIVGTVTLQAHIDATTHLVDTGQINAHVANNDGHQADYCLTINGNSNANPGTTGASLQNLWSPALGNAYAGSLSLTYTGAYRAALTFFDQRNAGGTWSGQPTWAATSLSGAANALPLGWSNVDVKMGVNAAHWYCNNATTCGARTPVYASIGQLVEVRVGVSATGSTTAPSLNYARISPALSAAPYAGASLSWVDSALPYQTYLCPARIDATPNGVTPPADGACPNFESPSAAFNSCATPNGQSACNVTLRWRIAASYPNARVTAYDVDSGATTAVSMPSDPLASTGTSFAIPAGKRYRFEVRTGTDANAPTIARSQPIAASGGGASTLTASPNPCTIAGGGATCSVTLTWSTTQSASAFLFRVGVSPVAAAQLVPTSGTSGSIAQALLAGTYRYELHTTSVATSQTLATTPDLVVAQPTPSSIGAAPNPCPIAGGGSTCNVTVSWTGPGSQVYLYQIGVNPAAAPQWIPTSGTSGSIVRALAAGTYRYELHSTNSPTAGLLATSAEISVTAGGDAAVPPAPALAAVPAEDAVSTAVGHTGGLFRVDENGAATYRIGIDTAPGRAGLTPQLAIVYNSGAGDGIAGWGATLEGVGIVARCRYAVESGDASNRPIGAQPGTHAFCLNGQRLILVSGIEGTAGAEYRTEIDGFERIVIDADEVVSPNGSGPPSTQPVSFTVRRKDGLTARYGTGTARRLAYQTYTAAFIQNPYVEDWWLASLTDTVGNRIDFSYSGDIAAGSLRLASIGYVGGRIDFGYATRPSASISFGAWGSTLSLDRWLNTVSVYGADNSLLRSYGLTYEAVPDNVALRRLSAVQTCAPAACQPPTVFDWYNPPVPTASQNSSGSGSLPNGGGLFQDMRAFKYADIDGDGRSDLVWADKAKGLWVSYSRPTSAGIAFSAAQSVTSIQCEGGVGEPCDSDGYNRTWTMFDYNADGREDLLLYKNGAWRIWLSDGTRLYDANIALPNSAAQVPTKTPRLVMADFDGDGLADIVVNETSFAGGIRAWMLRRTGNAAAPYSYAGPYAVVTDTGIGGLCSLGMLFRYNAERSEALDFNGDGLSDLALRVPSSTCGNGGRSEEPDSAPDWAALQQASPGSAIVDTAASGGTAILFASAGLNAQNQLVFSRLPELFGLDSANPDAIRFGDINGDGRVDVLFRQPGNVTEGMYRWDEVWRYFLSTGRGFSGPAGGYCVYQVGSTCQPVGRLGVVSLLDYDGDGRLDVWSRHYSSSGSGDLAYDVLVWNGSGFSAPFTTYFWGGDDSYMRSFADIDGDGYYDNLVMRYTSSGANWAAKRSSAHHQPRNLLKAVGHGLGATTTLDYAPLTFGSVYQREYDAPMLASGRDTVVQDGLSPRYVVRRARSTAPLEGAPQNVAEMRYRYAGYKLQGGGRGGLGFHRVFSYDPANNLVTATEYTQAFPLTGIPKATTLQFASALAATDPCGNPDAAACMTYGGWIGDLGTGNLLNETRDTWHWRAIGAAGVGSGTVDPPLAGLRWPLHVFRSQSSVIKRDAAAFVSASNTSFADYDDYGNLLASTSTDYDDAAMQSPARTVTTANTYDDTPSTWILGRLRTSTVATARAGRPTIARSTSFDYTAAGLLWVERLQPNGPSTQASIKVHTYDANGNETGLATCSSVVSESACKATSATSIVFQSADDLRVQRTTSRVYDTQNLFPVEERGLFYAGRAADIASANEFVTAVVEHRDGYGNVTRAHDVNSVVNLAGYDGFGRKYFESSSAGATSQVQRRWCLGFASARVGVDCPTDAGGAYAVYRVATTASGAPTVWTYVDTLEREVLVVRQGLAANQYLAVRKTYDGLGRMRTVSEPYFTYSPDSASVGQPNGVTVYRSTTDYDYLGRSTRINHANGAATDIAYAGRTTTTTLPPNQSGVRETRSEARNVLDEAVLVTDHIGSTVAYAYDAAGNAVAVTRTTWDGKVAVTTAQYDELGRKIQLVDPEAGTWYFRYNALGELVRKWTSTTCEQSLIDGRGRVHSRRDFVGLSCVTGTPDASTAWVFDTAARGLGQIDTVSHDDAGSAYTRTTRYDAYGRPNDVETSVLGTIYRELATFDAYGRTFQTFFQGNAVPRTGELFEYNAQGYQYRVRNAFPGTSGAIYRETLAMDAAGRAVQERRADNSNLVTSRQYDPATGRLKNITTAGGTLQSLNYEYDAIGNMLYREDLSGGNALHEDYTYDALQRLTGATARQSNGTSLPTFAANYDGLGNPLNGGSYGSLGNGCTANGETTPGSGALSVLGTNTFCYDTHGNLTRTLDTANGPGLEKRRIVYSSYDAARELRHQNAFSLHTTRYVYGPERQVIQRLDYANATAAGTPETTQFVGGAEIILKPGSSQREVKRTLPGLILSLTVNADGSLAAQRYEYLFADALGSTHRIVDAAGNLLSPNGAQAFTPFGARAAPATGVLLDGPSRFGFDAALTHSGYTGHQQNDATGLIHMGARLYDPLLGRFIQADSIVPDAGNLQSLNRYSYVLNNPLAYTDPTGHWGKQQQGYLRMAIAIVISIYTGVAIDSGTFLGMQVTASNAVGFAMMGGFAAGAVQTGTLRGAVVGAFAAGVNYGIGSYYGNVDGFNASYVLTHAAAGGFIEVLNGGKFGHGFVSAGLSTALSPTVDTGSAVGDGTLHAIIGGTTSELSGGKFANGAMSSAFSFVFNQYLHEATATAAQRAQVANLDYHDIQRGDATIENMVALGGTGSVIWRTQSGCNGDDRCAGDPPVAGTIIGHTHVYPAGSRGSSQDAKAARLSRDMPGPGDWSSLLQDRPAAVWTPGGYKYLIDGKASNPVLHYLGGGDPAFGHFVEQNWHRPLSDASLKALANQYLDQQRQR